MGKDCGRFSKDLIGRIHNAIFTETSSNILPLKIVFALQLSSGFLQLSKTLQGWLCFSVTKT